MRTGLHLRSRSSRRAARRIGCRSRARRWQAATPLEGAIYAETIPFNETRDYVKKVMTNATYYASLFNEPQTSLKQRMGTVPGR